MTITDTQAREINRAARFEGDSDTPAIVVGGVAVHVYVKGGRVCVSVHLDTGEVPDELLTEDETVPLTIKVNGDEVFDVD
jgi:hypothetical protein